MTRDFLSTYVDYHTVSTTVLANTRSNHGGFTIGTRHTHTRPHLYTDRILCCRCCQSAVGPPTCIALHVHNIKLRTSTDNVRPASFMCVHRPTYRHTPSAVAAAAACRTYIIRPCTLAAAAASYHRPRVVQVYVLSYPCPYP